jgi:AraC-like DNA-binding protein
MRELQSSCPEIFEDEDIDGTSRQFLGWEVELIHLGRGPMRQSSVVVPLGAASIALVQVRRATALRIVSAPSDFSLMSTSPSSPPPRVAARPLVGGVCLMFGPRAPIEIYLPKNCCVFILSVPCDATRRAGGSESFATLPIDTQTELRSLSAEHAALLSRCMDLLESFRRSGVPEVVAPQVQGRLQELLGASAARLFYDSRPLPPETKAKAVRRRAVTRACTHIDEHLREPITLDALCDAAGVRARTLEYGFREFYDVGPMAYLRSARLCRVRRELLKARGAGASVARAARRWNFSHMGQFSRDYRLLFGESPSATLARRRDPSKRLAVGG